MQKMILNMYYHYATSGSKTVTYVELRDIYHSKLSFKRAVNYLVEGKYLYKNRIDYDKVEYSLTISGEMLARLLCSLPDLPDHFKEIRWKLVL